LSQYTSSCDKPASAGSGNDAARSRCSSHDSQRSLDGKSDGVSNGLELAVTASSCGSRYHTYARAGCMAAISVSLTRRDSSHNDSTRRESSSIFIINCSRSYSSRKNRRSSARWIGVRNFSTIAASASQNR
jgi:hypothetical protein